MSIGIYRLPTRPAILSYSHDRREYYQKQGIGQRPRDADLVFFFT